MLKIYGRANSINVRKVLWALEEMGLEYKREDWGRGFRPVSDPEFLAINPFGQVPVLDDDGFILAESHAIVRYLAGRQGREDLLPIEGKKRAVIESWMEWQGTEVTNAARAAVVSHVFQIQPVGGQAAIDAACAEWPGKMAVIEDQLAKTEAFITGADFTLADICIGLTVNRWIMVPTGAKPDFPAIAAYYDRLGERPGFRKHGRNGMP